MRVQGNSKKRGASGWSDDLIVNTLSQVHMYVYTHAHTRVYIYIYIIILSPSHPLDASLYGAL